MKNPELFLDHRDHAQAVREMVRQMPGRRLPSERDLAASLQISRPRLRVILASLRAEGLIEQRPGSGTYAVIADGRHLRRIVLLIDEKLKLRDDPFFSHLLDCLQAALQAEGARCQIERVNGGNDSPNLEDGALTVGLAGQQVIERLRPNDPPVVGLLLPPETRPNRRASVFLLEDHAAGQTAGNYLLERGCRDIVFLGRRDIPASRERLAGLDSAIAPAGARLQFVETHLNYAAGLKLGGSLPLPAGTGPVGLVATNDWLAAGLHAGLLGHPTTREVVQVSFDGLRLTEEAGTGVRSLAVPIDAIAEDAVAELRRLSRTPVSRGRVVSYPLHWTHEE